MTGEAVSTSPAVKTSVAFKDGAICKCFALADVLADGEVTEILSLAIRIYTRSRKDRACLYTTRHGSLDAPNERAERVLCVVLSSLCPCYI